MRQLLSESGMEALMRSVSADPLLALDYDGTLAPIRADRDAAVLSDATRALLAQAAARYHTVVISGRGLADLRRLIGDIKGLELIGNHGAEGPEADTREYRKEVTAWRQQLERRLAPLHGITIEDKRASISVHYRDARPWTVARSVILDAVAGLEGARVVGGKAVINLVPAAAPHKGQAVIAACNRSCRTHAIYVGDDETDEDVFRLDDPQHIMTIRVGYRSKSSAMWFLSARKQLNAMLRMLIRFHTVQQFTGGFLSGTQLPH